MPLLKWSCTFRLAATASQQGVPDRIVAALPRISEWQPQGHRPWGWSAPIELSGSTCHLFVVHPQPADIHAVREEPANEAPPCKRERIRAHRGQRAGQLGCIGSSERFSWAQRKQGERIARQIRNHRPHGRRQGVCGLKPAIGRAVGNRRISGSSG